MNGCDWLVLTAANPVQARGYKAQLESRRKRGLLDPVNRWRILADPRGQRVGSGGSTLWVLWQLARELSARRPGIRDLASLFAGQRIVVIHSGGDSRRLCAYAAQGKVFAPLPCDVPGRSDQPATLFDLILRDLLELPAAPDGQVLLAAGDVLLTFDSSATRFDRPGITGVAYPGPLERGTKHGVYLTDAGHRVVDFLQKPDEAAARASGAVDDVGRVLIDTGIISLDPPTVEKMLRMAGARISRGRPVRGVSILKQLEEGGCPTIDLYEQLLIAVPGGIDQRSYLKRLGGAHTTGTASSRSTEAILKKIHGGLNGIPFHANVLPWCEFFHIGATRELLTNMSGLNRTAQHFQFRNLDRSSLPANASIEGAFIFNSILADCAIRTGPNVYIEACHLQGVDLVLEGRNVLVGLPSKLKRKLVLPEGVGLACFPLPRGRWTAVLFGIEDDFKTPLERGGTFLHEPMDRMLSRRGWEPGRLWPKGAESGRTLWEARLWSSGSLSQVVDHALGFLDQSSRRAKWSAAGKLNMAEILRRVDHARLIEHRLDIQRRGELEHLGTRLLRHPWLPAEHIVAQLQDQTEAREALSQIRGVLKRNDQPLVEARLLKLVDVILKAYPKLGQVLPAGSGADPLSDSLAAVARAVAQQAPAVTEPKPAAILHDQACWVTTPARLDFAGGWSDTPPICTELGGTVINAAVTLNGQYPIQVMAKLSENPWITLSSIDLGRRIEIRSTRDALTYTDPADWAALPKAALVLAGICPRDPKRKLEDWLNVLGGGLDVTLFSALPKGSGLGTSSILGAAMLACLARITGEPMAGSGAPKLIARTSILEQMMTTAGGWQDQVGGMTPGVKIIRSSPGPEQALSLHWAGMDMSMRDALRDRMLLYFTGQKRLARNILQNVVGRYLGRDPATVALIGQLKDGAERMKDHLDRGDVEAFARGIDDYWSMKKRIDPGSTNPAIEKLLRPIEPLLAGKVLPGAGGGGFIFMIARDAEAARAIRNVLESKPPNRFARFFEFGIDPVGMKITVL
ncbi:MAG: hypothetical protein JJU36_10905 [Phycisphaeraceae bacterium]|nr:hypothetical protein [Phycisphaeraceae bacterium]